jgi:hypothetical protein
VVAHDARTAGGLPLPGQRPAACFSADLLQESIVARLTFGAICPQRSVGAAIVIPEVYVEAMNQHLAEISRRVRVGAIALLVLDGAGWHSSPRLNVPANIVLLPLPPYSPELNPMENVWEFLRGNFLSHCVWDGYEAIIEACCDAWNKLMRMPENIASLTRRPWAKAVTG